MSVIDDANSTVSNDNTANPDVTVPVDQDGDPILWDNLKATIEGKLSQVAEWCGTTGYLSAFLRHRAVPHSKGIIFDSPESYTFYRRDFVDDHDPDDPAPAGPERVTAYNVDHPRAPFALPAFTADELREAGISFNPLRLEQEDAAWMRCLKKVFGACERAKPLIAKAKGSGTAFRALLVAEHAKATPAELAVVAGRFDVVKTFKLGELKLAPFSAHVSLYRKVRGELPKGERPKPLAEVQTIARVALADKDVRPQWLIDAKLTPPTNFDSAVDLLQEILRNAETFEEMEEQVNGAQPAAALAAVGQRRGATPRGGAPRGAPPPDPPPSPPDMAKAVALMSDMVALMAKANGATGGGPPDPHKGSGEQLTAKQKRAAKKAAKKAAEAAAKSTNAASDTAAKQQRDQAEYKARLKELGALDADGNVVRWVAGMRACRHCSGNHLDKDCNQQGAAHVSEADELAALRERLNGFLGANGGTQTAGFAGCVEQVTEPPAPAEPTAKTAQPNAPAWAGGCDCGACAIGLKGACFGCIDEWCAAAAPDRPRDSPARSPPAAAPPPDSPCLASPPADAKLVGISLRGGGGRESASVERGGEERVGPSERVSGGGSKLINNACYDMRDHASPARLQSPIDCNHTRSRSPANLAASPANLAAISPLSAAVFEDVPPQTRTSQASATVVQVSPPDLSMVSGPCPSRSGGLENYGIRTASAPLQAVPVGVAATTGQDCVLPAGTPTLPPGLETYAASIAGHVHDMACELPRSAPRVHGMSMPGMPQTAPRHASTAHVSRANEGHTHGTGCNPRTGSATLTETSRATRSEREREKHAPCTSTMPSAAAHSAMIAPRPHKRASLPHADLVSAAERLRSQQKSATIKGMKRLLEVTMLAHPDSGCTGSLTPDSSVLVNVKECSETFSAANGVVAKATCVGDLPVVALTDSGRRTLIIFSNVRCVPAFGYTLLSVKQLWREQRIDARFADINALVLPSSSGMSKLPYDADRELPTLRLLSAVKLAAVLPTPSRAALSSSQQSTSRPRVQWAAPVVAEVRSFVKDSDYTQLQRATAQSINDGKSLARAAWRLERSAALTASPSSTRASPSELPRAASSPAPSTPVTPNAAAAPSPPLMPSRAKPVIDLPVRYVTDPAIASAPVDDGTSEPEPAPSAATGRSSQPLGFHIIGSTSHVSKLPAAQAAQLMQRRSHLGVTKLRALAHTTSDAPKVLASAPAVPMTLADAQASIKKSRHSSTLSAPAPEPGTLHVDLKEMIVSTNGYRYIVFLIDEYSRYVFFDFIKKKSEADAAAKRCIALFNATVYTPTDEHGRALPRPSVRWIHSDREGKLMSHAFRDFRADEVLHHTTSPPHDHDLNPIPERIIGLIAERATAIRVASHASPRLWPWIVAYAVDWHNASSTSVGSSTADANISPHQRFTLQLPKVMDLPAFGCRAVVLKPPTHQHKPSLSSRGWVGSFLGRSRNSKGAYDVLVDGKVVTSSSVLVDEEHFDWAPPQLRHQPLASLTHSASAPRHTPLLPPSSTATSSNASARATYSKRLVFLNLFSGPYGRANGLSAKMQRAGWHVVQVDNDGEHGGGWKHDLLNDAFFAELLARAKAGEFEALMIAFPCGTFAVSRFFDATSSNGGDGGPPVIRDFNHPDGKPEDEIDPKHIRELRLSNELLVRTVALATAARRSPAKTSIIVENPADRSPGASIASAPEFANHGSLFRTSFFLQLAADVGLDSHVTFAYCRLGSPYQKYTTLYYTPECGSVLDVLSSPDYQCNHERGTHKSTGGRLPSGEFASSAAAAYPEQLCEMLTRAFTVARTGGETIVQQPFDDRRDVRERAPLEQADRDRDEPSAELARAPPTAISGGVSTPRRSPATAPAATPLSFPELGSVSAPRTGPPATTQREQPTAARPGELRRLQPHPEFDGSHFRSSPSAPPVVGNDGRPRRATLFRTTGASYNESSRARPASTQRPATPVPSTPVRSRLDSVTEEASSPEPESSPDMSPGGTAARGYSPFAGVAQELASSTDARDADAADIMRQAVIETAFAAAGGAPGGDGSELTPITRWVSVPSPPLSGRIGKPSACKRSVAVNVELRNGEKISRALMARIGEALRADSPDAPSTHAEAMARGEIWWLAEKKELDNHAKNESWVTIPRSELPPGRRVHKLIWVYKVKRDGTAKARLCVQGTTLEEGVDYDQVWSSALRYTSARALFAFAARNGCKVRSVDLVAAYLQGKFVDGEVVYCHLPTGYPEYDSKGCPKLAKVQKPIYGIQQAGRRLQRMLFKWFIDYGFKQHDDSDSCIFSLECASGEILTIGVYVDNLQIVHSVEVNAAGRGPEGCAYNAFMDAFSSVWDVTDEGPMEDLLGIEVEYNADGSIKLHQRKYIEKIVARFLPDGPLPKSQRNSLPYSNYFVQNINEALSQSGTEHPELMAPLQRRVGCLMYATTSTRPDVAYAVHQLCKCLHKPTPALMRETDHLLSYLARTADLGLTYTKEHARLAGYADASWETAASTSGWVVLWQTAALSWGSRKQKSIALSTCEAEIISLSEATKDVVYLRKLVNGLRAPEPGPTTLSTDSQSARDVSYNPQHHDRMKHVARRHFFVRDMVESFEIEVPFVPTNQNPADFFTKPMKNAKQFREFRRIVMNERD